MANRTVIIAARLTRSQAAALRRLARAQVPRQTRSQFVAGLVQAELERQQDRANVVGFLEQELHKAEGGMDR